jgi:hypothetical protein
LIIILGFKDSSLKLQTYVIYYDAGTTPPTKLSTDLDFNDAADFKFTASNPGSSIKPYYVISFMNESYKFN